MAQKRTRALEGQVQFFRQRPPINLGHAVRQQGHTTINLINLTQASVQQAELQRSAEALRRNSCTWLQIMEVTFLLARLLVRQSSIEQRGTLEVSVARRGEE